MIFLSKLIDSIAKVREAVTHDRSGDEASTQLSTQSSNYEELHNESQSSTPSSSDSSFSQDMPDINNLRIENGTINFSLTTKII